MIETKKTFNLNMHVARLLMDEPFFASLSRRINKTANTTIPTAGVRVNPDTAQFEMFYNPDFFEKLDDAARKDVLKHEFYHLVFEHVTGRKPEGVKPMTWNFATDLAINSHLENLPEGCLKPGQEPFEDFAPGLSAEAYLELLKKKQDSEEDSDEEGQSGEGSGEGTGEGSGEDKPNEGSGNMPTDGQFDSHEGWGAADQITEEIAKERLKDFIKKAAEEASQNGQGWGSVPASCRRDIMDRLQTRVDWTKVLRYFVKTSTRANRRSTVKRLNKRYSYIHPGKKVIRRAKIAISIDQSGSVDDEMLKAFFSELSKLAKLASFTVVPFDTRVDESLVYEWKKGQNHKTERVMCGGTCFDAPTKYVNDKGFDGHIILTDMMAPKPKASKCQRMWMTTKHYAQHPYFKTNERVLAIDV